MQQIVQIGRDKTQAQNYAKTKGISSKKISFVLFCNVIIIMTFFFNVLTSRLRMIKPICISQKMSLEISSLCFMQSYSSDPLSHALMCIPMGLPPSFHGYLLEKISFF